MTGQIMMNGNWILFPGKNYLFSEEELSISCTYTDVLDMEGHVFVNLLSITVNIRQKKVHVIVTAVTQVLLLASLCTVRVE
jgi:hypothetical protein